MKTWKYPILLFALLGVLLTSACSGSNIMVASSWPGLTTDQETAYLAYGQYVYAINLESGTLKWRYPADKPDRTQFFYATPALTQSGEVVVGGYDHKLYKLNALNGQLIWTYEDAKDRYIAGPLVTEAGIFAPNADGKVYALDQNKMPLWPAFETKSHLWAKPATDAHCECIYISSMDHHLYAVDSKTGDLLWKSPDLGGALVAEPTFSEDGTIYLGTFGNEMLALKASNGEVKWRYITSGWVWSAARLVDGKLSFGDLKGFFYILDASTGTAITEEVLDGPIVGTPAYDGQDTIYVGTEAGTLYAYRLDGSRLWMKSIAGMQKDNKAIGGKLHSPVIAVNDILLVAPTESAALLIALNKTGEPKWLYYFED